MSLSIPKFGVVRHRQVELLRILSNRRQNELIIAIPHQLSPAKIKDGTGGGEGIRIPLWFSHQWPKSSGCHSHLSADFTDIEASEIGFLVSCSAQLNIRFSQAGLMVARRLSLEQFVNA